MTALPTWMTPLPDAAQQRALDSWAIEQCAIAGERLMETAGTALAHVVSDSVPEGPIAIVCGRGNNGGDGFVAARHLLDGGRDVRVLLLAEPDAYAGDAKLNLERLASDAVAPFTPQALDGAAGIVDALLGTGFAGVAREPIAGAIAAINAVRGGGANAAGGEDATSGSGMAPVRVIACDIPSGVDGSTGEVAGAAVRADATVTFHAAKPGLWISPGKQHVGRLHVIDIGIPREGRPQAATLGLIDDTVRFTIPRRDAVSNKFTAGAVLVVGGSRGLTGAPVMAALAAARAGAGYVTVAAPASVASAIASKLLEVMTVELPDDPESGPKRGSSRMAVERASRAQALVLGPGLGRMPAAVKFARDVARHAGVALVLDADGLNAHAEDEGLEALRARTAPTVLTPHTGELARLLQRSSAEVETQRLDCAREAATRSGAVVVLKGDDTLVAEPGGRVAVSAGGAPALATAGSGDVLSGVIGAFLAKGVDPFTAACAGVDTHLVAGRIAAHEVGAEGVIASDVIAALPRARTAAVRCESQEASAR